MHLQRRFARFLLLLFLAVMPLWACRWGTDARRADEAARPFSFVVLGDLHLDRLEHHDLAQVEQKHGADDVRQIQQYSQLTETVVPKLLAELREATAAHKPRVAFVAQAGDFTEGLCGDPQRAQKHFEDAVAMVRGARLGVPFLITKGNHDNTGEGAPEAYRRVVLPFLAEQSGRAVDSASFAYEHGGALIVFFDAYDRGSLDWLEEMLAARTARHVFVVCHPPIVPINARATWYLYSNPKQQEQRKRMLDLLGRHRAIVFAAHLHKYAVVVRRTETGRFLQLSLNSVLSSPDSQPKNKLSGREHYGPDLVKLEPEFQPDAVQQSRDILAAEAPFVERYEYADAAGYAIVTVRNDRVDAQIHAGLGRLPWKTLNLSALRDGR